MGGFAWVTLATNDSYSLGALVLGHSLKRAGTPHDLVALVTPGVSEAMRSQLSTVFTLVKEVNVLDSRDEANLALLERPELGITFTKLHCWRLTQYEKCVFLDADTLVLKNSDELFEREELSAAPDPGWPDCFNSGVFVYRPSLDTFNALIKFALAKGSFDGGDQGLLNMFFSDWATKDISRHLPFIYNMVSTATYSYLPAYKQFGEGAKIAHFIGANKPWLQYFDSETRLARPPPGSEHIQPLLQLWWDVFCSTVHPSLSPEMLGLAGALAQLTLGVPRTAEQTAFEEHMRRQAWEHGNMDYMGRDSFDNIWRKITETLAQAPTKPATEEVPPTKSAPEPKLPESKTPAPKSRKSPPAETSEPSGLCSAVEQTSDQSSKITEIPTEPSPQASKAIVPSPQIAEQEKPVPAVPHTPSITEATPPTSPPIVVPTAPLADIQALKVDAPSPETPPVGSGTSDLVSDKQLKTTQSVEPPEQAVPVSKDLGLQGSAGTETPVVVDQNESSKTPKSTIKSSQEVPALKEISSSALPTTPEEAATPTIDKAASVLSSVPQIPSTQETALGTDVKGEQVSVPHPIDETESLAKSIAEKVVIAQTTDKADVSAPGITDTIRVVVPKTEVPASGIEVKPVVEKKVTQQTEAEVPAAVLTEIKTTTEKETPLVIDKGVPEAIDKTPSTISLPASDKQAQLTATQGSVPSPPTSDKTQATETSAPISPPLSSDQAKSAETPAPILPPPSNDKAQVTVAPSPISPPSSDQAQVAEAPAPISPPSSDKAQAAETPAAPVSPPSSDKAQAAETPAPISPPHPPPPSNDQVTKTQAPASSPPTNDQAKAAKTQSPVIPQPSNDQAQIAPQPSSDKTQITKPESGEKLVPKPVVKEKEASAKSAGKKQSAELKGGSGQVTQSEQVPKSSSKPSGPSAPSTPEAAPSDQAPIPPKRRGHKNAGTASASEQGAASKSTSQSQPQQTKGSKSAQKSKK